jgi:hypothetical protein
MVSMRLKCCSFINDPDWENSDPKRQNIERWEGGSLKS